MKKPGEGITTFGVALFSIMLLLSVVTYAWQPQSAHAVNNQLQTMLVKGPVTSFSSGQTVSSTAVCPQQDQVVTGGSFESSITAPGSGGTLQGQQSQPSPTSWMASLMFWTNFVPTSR